MASSSKAGNNVVDAIVHVQRAVDAELSGIQDKAREEIASAMSDAREAQRERDEVMRLLESERLGWKHEKAVLQASVAQSEMNVRHQAETILQLQRSEESARNDALDWKEQLRVEQERCRLAESERRRLTARLEEVVSEQLSSNQTQMHVAPLTPQSRPAYTESTSASNSGKRRASTSHHRLASQKAGHLPSPTDMESPQDEMEEDAHDYYYAQQQQQQHHQQRAHTSGHQQQHRRAHSQSHAQARTPRTPAHPQAGPSSSSHQGQQPATVPRRKTVQATAPSTSARSAHPTHAPSESRVIRRVRAVVEMPPIKRESISDIGEAQGQEQMYEEEQYEEEGEEEAEEEEEEEDEQAPVSAHRPVVKKKSGSSHAPPGRRAAPQDESEGEEQSELEDDDELMIGVEEDHDQVYGAPRTSASAKRGRSATTTASKAKRVSSNPPVKKRKLLDGGSRTTNNSSKTKRHN